MSEKLLYDIVQLLEWPTEEEKVQETKTETSIFKASYELVSLSSKKALSYFSLLGIPYKKANHLQILDALTNLTQQRKWRFSVSPDHKYVVILQKHLLEVRYLDEELTITGNHSIPDFLFNTKQVVAWDVDSRTFAATLDSKNVLLFDTTCTLLSTIKLTQDTETEEQTPRNVVCCMMFMKARSQKQIYEWELLILATSGTLASYFISHSKECELSHTFNFGVAYYHGISCAFMDESSRLLVLGGNTSCGVDFGQEVIGSNFGITKWRILSDFPYYTKDLSESMNSTGKFEKGVLKRAYTYSKDALQKLYTTSMDGVYAMALSPDQSKVVAVHYNGDLSYWDFPSLRMKSKWSLQEQPHHSDVDPSLTSRFGRKRRHDDNGPISFYPFDVSWWNNESVVVSRCSGCLTILSVAQPELLNMFGEQCEWVTPFCQMSSTLNERFYMLECNTETVSSKKMKTDSTAGNDDDDDDEESSLVQRGISFAKRYTGVAPPKSKERHYSHKYSLTTLTKTTPQELYQRKIDDKEYGEALSIAQVYNLDCDKVFQRQWRSSPVSKATIQDYLSKVANRHWVFRECMDRVPERMDDVKELLEFALRITDIDKMAALTKSSEPAVADEDDEEVDDYDGFDFEVQKQREMEKRQKFEGKWLAQVDLENLSLEQNEMLTCRQKILKFKDRLSTYILLLGGYDAANERYTANDFATFRKRDFFHMALEYVRSSKWESLDILLQYHTNRLIPHWLPLLSNFSETISPSTYQCLLPAVRDGKVLSLVRHQHRPCVDWSETIVTTTPRLDVEEFYESNSFLTKFSVNEISPQLASEWYQQRAKQMEKLTQQTEEALELIEIGIEKGISGLSQLQLDLITLDNLVFECGCELVLSLDDLVQKSPLERIRLMMAQSVPTTYVRDIQQLVLPFVKLCDEEKLFETFLIEAAEQNLVLPFLVFKYMFTHKPSDCNFHSKNEVIYTAVDCIYAMEVAAQLDIAYRIVACLPKCDGHDKAELKEKVSALEKNLDVCSIFARHNVPMTPNQLREIAEDRSQVLLLFKRLTRTLARQEIIAAGQVRSVLDDMLSISSGMFSSMIDQTTCVHVLIESLLTSGIAENIRLAGNVMVRAADQTPSSGRKLQLPYKDSVELVLRSSREYFDAASIPLQNNKLLQTSRLCLHLITDRPPEIQEQLNLIEAVSLLSAFGLEMLPLEVRLCKDRLDIVEKVLDLSSSNYMKEEPVLRLSSLLNVSGHDKKEQIGRTKCTIVEKALKNSDLKVAQRLVKDLISMNYAHAWKLCAQLGTCKDVSDLQFRHSCVSFASCYCGEEVLAAMTEELCKVRALLLEQTLEEQMMQLEELHQDSEAPKEDKVKIPDLPVSRTLKASADLLAGTVTATTGVFLSGLSLLKRQSLTSVSSSAAVDVDSPDRGDNDFETQTCPAFYKSVVPSADKDIYNIDRYSSPNQLSVLQQQTILRISKLANMGDRLLENLRTLASMTLTEDLPLALSYLLAITDAKHIEESFQTHPLTSLSLQLSIYCHCLKHFSNSFPVATECLPIYRTPPSEFIDYAIKHFNVRGSTVTTTSLEQAVGNLINFIQGEKLSDLGQDVDMARCMVDKDYMMDITHGLALTTDEDQFLMAVLLADQGQCDVWEVALAHVEFLFTETGSMMKQNEFFEMLNRLEVLPVLVSREKELFTRLDADVFPLIDGQDHSTLLCYFNLLKECDWSQLEELETVNDTCKMSPHTHVKYLQKIANCVQDLDYKMLVRRNASLEILDLLKKSLNGNNVTMLTKIIPKIPYENYNITSSSIILRWVEKRFWQIDSEQSTNENWMKKLEHMNKWLVQLDAGNLQSFFEDLLFSQEAVNTFAYDLRLQFLKFGLKFIKTQTESKSSSDLQNFNNLKKYLEKLNGHFSIFSTKFMKEVIESASTDAKKREFLVAYDLSRSEPEKLLHIAVQSILESVGFTKRFLAVLPDVKWTLEFVLKTCTTQLTKQLSDASDDSAVKLALSSLESLLSSIEECRGKEKSKLLDLVVSIVQDFCNDKSIDIKLKIDVLQLLRKSASLNPNQVEFLLFHRTSELVRAGWGEGTADQVLKDISSISDDSSHIAIVNHLLQQNNSLQQVKSLSKIVEILRQGISSDTPTSDEIWLKVLLAFAQHGARGGDEIVCKAKQLNVSEKVALPVFEKLVSGCTVLAAVKLALITSMPSVDDKLRSMLEGVEEINDSNCDEEMLSLIVDSDKTLFTLSTLYYHRVVEYLVSDNCENAKDKVDRLVRRLQDNGDISEAATLLLRYRGSHTVFATFGSSISLLSDWLTKF